MSTEIAKSFTSKDLAETFPRQIPSLEYLRETAFSQSREMSILTSDSETDKSVNNKVNVPSVNVQVGLDLSHDDAAGPIDHEVDPVTKLLGVMLLGAWKGNSDNVEPSDSSGDGRMYSTQGRRGHIPGRRGAPSGRTSYDWSMSC